MADNSNALGTDFFLGSSGVQYEIMRKSHFKVDLQGIDSRLSCQDAQIPRIELEAVEVFYFNDRIKLASKPNPADASFQVLDYVQPTVVQELWSWFKQIYDPGTRNMGYSNSYKRTGIITLYDPNGNAVRAWTMSGIWPKNSPTPSEAYRYEDGQDKVQIEMAFSVDLITLDAGTANTAAGLA